MSPDTIKYFEGLLSIYTDNIRISDIKSNIILFFLTVSIPTVVACRAQLPVYVPLLLLLYPDLIEWEKCLPIAGYWIRLRHDSRRLSVTGERSALIALARDGSVTIRLARRANALVLLDGGMSCEQVAQVLFLDDDTVRRGIARLPKAAARRSCVLRPAAAPAR